MYIRTDFHIYEIKSEEIIQGEKYYNIEIRGGLNKLKAEFGKQSENLEELCDEFVIEYRDGSKIISIHDNTDDFLREHKGEIESGCIKNVYGGIWTDKGLIYVAKMNDKGELELI